MKILITGGAGFIGSNFVCYLTRRQKNKIHIIDNLERGRLGFLAPAQGKFSWQKIDITDEKKMANAFAAFKPDVVLHLAAKHYIPECEAEPEKTLATNVYGTYAVANLSNRWRVKHLIFASSAAVYKQPGQRKESDEIGAQDVYGLSKILAEKIIEIYCARPWTIFRLFNIIGPNETNDHLIETITDQLKAGNRIKIGNPKTKRDYLHTDDLCPALTASLLNPKTFGQIINLGRGQAISGGQIIKKIKKITGRQISLQIEKRRWRKIDKPILCANAAKAKKILNWQAQKPLIKNLREILEQKNIPLLKTYDK